MVHPQALRQSRRLVAKLTARELLLLYVALDMQTEHFRRNWWRTGRVWRWRDRRQYQRNAHFMKVMVYDIAADGAQNEPFEVDVPHMYLPPVRAALIGQRLEACIESCTDERDTYLDYLEPFPRRLSEVDGRSGAVPT